MDVAVLCSRLFHFLRVFLLFSSSFFNLVFVAVVVVVVVFHRVSVDRSRPRVDDRRLVVLFNRIEHPSTGSVP